ncbi:MAG: DeoR/GlpR transcriptional regulator [Ruminococcaceae bacterium]|nr:DeoR/GlpR transcriptional regulator [Oscillospiraceae bacterium]
MLAPERQKFIMDEMHKDGAVTVSRLATELNVTEETIRRDLEKLEKQEALRRTHGGAVPIDGTTYELSLEKRKSTNVEQKQKIASIAANFVFSGDTIFLDASTTTFFLAKELKKLKNITIITNSLRVVAELSSCEHIKLIAVGGIVSSNQSFVGSLAEKSIKDCYFANKMFFSAKGVTKEIGILESNEQECGIKQNMLINSENKYFLCDSAKFGRVSFAKLASLGDIDYLITEKEPDEEFMSALEDNNVKVVTQ